MPITTCVKVEWKDIFLNRATFNNEENIPLIIEVKSLNNSSLINSTVDFTLDIEDYNVVKSTSDNTLTTTNISENKLVFTVKLTPEDDLWGIPIDSSSYTVNYYIDITTPDICKLRIGAGLFYVEQKD